MRVFLNKGRSILKSKFALSFVSIIILLLLISLIVPSFAALTPVASVMIDSESVSYNAPGGFRITKSARWISMGTARITIDVDSSLMVENNGSGVIIVLDVSSSMDGTKLNKVKEDTAYLANELISKGSRVALVAFDTTARVLTDFTTDITLITNSINSLNATGGTNYYQALDSVDQILKGYQYRENKKCIVLFLTDGCPSEDTPNQVAKFKYLKTTYPYLTINGIQYEMGEAILPQIVEVTDNQYIASLDTLNTILFQASGNTVGYTNFELTDYINSNYFTVPDASSIRSSIGKVRLVNNKVVWNLDGVDSGNKYTLSIDIKLNDEILEVGGVYPINEKLEVKSKINDMTEEISSTKSPALANKYQIIYDVNAPEGCTVINTPDNTKALALDTISITDKEPSCLGYQFNGWKIVTENVTRVNDDNFIMPEEDVVIRAVWSKVSLSKSMNGTIYTVPTLYEMIASNSVDDNVASQHVVYSTGIDFTDVPSDANGKGVYRAVKLEGENTPIYYYRGDVTNNNVIFANYCWKIVRTTDTGGVKLIYNGKRTEKYASILIDKNSYINVSNDTTYPYTYDVSTKQWVSANKDDSSTSTMSFNVSTTGNYILSYSVSSEERYDIAYFYKDGVELGSYSGFQSGTIDLGQLNTSNVIMVKYVKDVSSFDGIDSVSFGVSRQTDNKVLSCDNSGLDAQIGESAYNSNTNSNAYVGYMYGNGSGTTYASVHANTNNSTIKGVVDS